MARTRVHNSAVSWIPHLHVAWGGVLGSGTKEIWTNSVRMYFASGTAPFAQDIDLYLPGLVSAVTTYHQASNATVGGASLISHEAKLAYVKANWILATGLQRDTQTHVSDISPTVDGYNSGNCPWYQTVAVTLRTPVSRGRAHAGRIFPPLVCPGFEANTGYIISADASGLTLAAANLVKNLNAAATGGPAGQGKVAIFSPGNTTKGTTPLVNVVDRVVVDRVPDVQHRRTDRLKRNETATQTIPA